MPTKSRSQLAGHWVATLRRDGYCIIPRLISEKAIRSLDRHLEEDFEQTPFCEGRFYGERTKRFGRLLRRSPLTARLVQHDLILAIVEEILSPWCDCIQLNLTQAIAVHPGALAQMPHRDQDMWRAPAGEVEYLVNVMWPFTAFREANGATRLWTGTHGKAALGDPPTTQPVIAEMEPGSVLIFLGSTLHAAGANRSNNVRRGMIAGYSLGWLKTYENQFLAYPPEIASAFHPDLAALVGYRQHRPNLGNFEGRCPSLLLSGGMADRLAAIDALRPDQIAAVDAHAAEERRTAA
ncbi:MAG TPA: phytanoyl-CoA dioxygenase family protein [Sphingomicrobium sp.]|nr:phytanoyl-CoA dioxygenase family protein [Sphingomicrobium sp.]